MAHRSPRDPLKVEPRAFIRANLPLVPIETIPEIRLHRAQPSSGLARIAVGSPYWAYPWPGGLGLARHVLDHPALVRGRRILDLGSGSGLVAIAAAKAGAQSVMAADTDPRSQDALALNAEANGVTLDIVGDDLLDGPPPPVDLVLAADVFYERRFADRVAGFLDRCVASGLEALVGDVGRPFLPRTRLLRIADYPVVEFGRATDTGVACTVYAVTGPDSEPGCGITL